MIAIPPAIITMMKLHSNTSGIVDSWLCEGVLILISTAVQRSPMNGPARSSSCCTRFPQPQSDAKTQTLFGIADLFRNRDRRGRRDHSRGYLLSRGGNFDEVGGLRWNDGYRIWIHRRKLPPVLAKSGVLERVSRPADCSHRDRQHHPEGRVYKTGYR